MFFIYSFSKIILVIAGGLIVPSKKKKKVDTEIHISQVKM